MTQLLSIFDHLPHIYCKHFIHIYFSLQPKFIASIEFKKIKSNQLYSSIILLQCSKYYPTLHFYIYHNIIHSIQSIPKYIYEKKCIFQVYYTSSYYLSTHKNIRNFIILIKQKQTFYQQKFSHSIISI